MTNTALVRLETEDHAPWLLVIAAITLLGGVWLRVRGLPGADLHGPLHRAGIMDPLCGGTRATYLLVRGDVAAAWSWNPLVPLLALAITAVVIRFIVGRLGGRWVNVYAPRRVWFVALVAGAVVLEINQQMQADRLTSVVPV